MFTELEPLVLLFLPGCSGHTCFQSRCKYKVNDIYRQMSAFGVTCSQNPSIQNTGDKSVNVILSAQNRTRCRVFVDVFVFSSCTSMQKQRNAHVHSL